VLTRLSANVRISLHLQQPLGLVYDFGAGHRLPSLLPNICQGIKDPMTN